LNPNPFSSTHSSAPATLSVSNTQTLKPPVILAFAVFAAAYFLSYAMRAVNAALSPDLRLELALSPESLGWLTSAYLVAFAAMQLPLGIWLDRYGARRVESVLLLIAAAGCALFASGHTFGQLFIGRALIGLGVSACLMAAFTSYRQWYAPELLSRLAAWMLVVGTSGALAASVPVRWLADAQGWRAVFWISCVAFALVAAALWGLFPKQAIVLSPPGSVNVGYRDIFRRQAIRATAPIAFFSQGGFIALQTLWAAPWLMQVLGQTSAQAAQTLFSLNAVLIGVYILIGTLGGKLSLAVERRVMLTGFVVCACCLLAMSIWRSPHSWWLLLVMAASSTGTMLMQARVGASLPKAIAGRGNVALNLVIFVGGFVLQGGIGWAANTAAQALDVPYAIGLALSFGSLAVAQLGGVFWLWLHWRTATHFDEVSDGV
jgi:predicted MFS family arabinose efflux permease